jgi:type IV secretion system protein TrbI
MTTPTADPAPPAPQAPTAEPNLRLRAEHPRVTRLSRRALVVLGGISALAVAATLGYGLQSRKNAGPSPDLLGAQGRPAAEGLAGLPQDYATVPRLGPALPGDLGKPTLNAQNQGKPVSVPTQGPSPIEQRLAQETEAARVSRLFAQTSQRRENAATPPRAVDTETVKTNGTPPVEADISQTLQDRKLAFVTGGVDRRAVAPDRLADPASPYALQAGAVIPAALITGIRSDLPGPIIAQATEAVYDSPTGRHLLIPQGARLIGQYDNSVDVGQSRILLVWTRLILPNGKSIVLERQPGADPQGYAGLEDGVDHHWGMQRLRAETWIPRIAAARRKLPCSAAAMAYRRWRNSIPLSIAPSRQDVRADTPFGSVGEAQIEPHPRLSTEFSHELRPLERLANWHDKVVQFLPLGHF